MKNVTGILVCCLFIACQGTKNNPGAQVIVDKSIEVSGGARYDSVRVSFRFRDINYSSFKGKKGYRLSRSFLQDSNEVLDVLEAGKFMRRLNGKEIAVPDSMAVKYTSSINSVHYFARLPFGLNDRAVRKRYLGEAVIDDNAYHKIEITFKEEGGGEDFDDVYVYWFNKATYKPDYLAYAYHVNGGGLRFRKALNERYVGGIRFVDYLNYKPQTPDFSVYQLDSLFIHNELELLSRIEIRDITVSPGSYN